MDYSLFLDIGTLAAVLSLWFRRFPKTSTQQVTPAPAVASRRRAWVIADGKKVWPKGQATATVPEAKVARLVCRDKGLDARLVVEGVDRG